MRYNDFKIVETRLKEQGTDAFATQPNHPMSGETRDLPIPPEIANPVLRLAPSLRQFVTYNSTYGIIGIKTVNGNTIRQLQQSLNRAGYDLQVDGQAGNNTSAAIIDIFYTIADAQNNFGVDPAIPAPRTNSESLVREGPFDDVVDAAGGNPQPFNGTQPAATTNRANVRANPDGSIGRPNAPQDNAQDNTQGLEAGPPYPQEDRDAIRSMQTKLEELGYSVGSTGIDGKYGPRTTRAVRAFKTDNNIQGDGSSMSTSDLETLNTAERVENPTPTGNTARTADVELGDLADIANLPQAKEVVEEYLGKPISDNDMNMLVRAIASEASSHNLERAAVAAVILNRVRVNYNNYGASIPAQLRAPAQFQAVTGTRTGPKDSEGRRTWTGPHENYTTMTSTTGGEVVGTLIQNLANQNRTWMNFTSNLTSAYTAGTNIDFMYAMRNAPNSQIIGQTVFGTV